MPRSTAPAAQSTARRLRTAVKNPRRVARAVRARLGGARVQPVQRGERAVIGHAEALAVNGFTVFRGLVPPQECAQLGARLKQAAGIVEGERFTRTDATFKIPETQDVLFDERVLGAVRTSIGDIVRFLQVSDLHYLHDTTNWHRDSVHRAEDNSEAPDWRDDQGRFGIVKAILYLESENAAMGIMPGSHRTPLEMDREHVKAVEKRNGQLIIGGRDDPNRRFPAAAQRDPVACRLEVGDLLVFDERMYHAGRRIEHGVVSRDQEAPKLTLSMVFGLDNAHSERLYSYFHYARSDLRFSAINPELNRRLAEHDLVPTRGWGNFYERAPHDLRFAYLRDPAELEPLIERFSQAGAGRSTEDPGTRA